MSETSTRYALPLLDAGQAQKEVTHNEAIDRVDALLHLAVASMDLTDPPPTPSLGTAWIVASGATGTWAGHDGQIATFGAGGWRIVTPRNGCLAWVEDLGIFAIRQGGGWVANAWPAKALHINGRNILGALQAAIPLPLGGGTIDVEARAAIVQIIQSLQALGLADG